jgi:hypothetical protein
MIYGMANAFEANASSLVRKRRAIAGGPDRVLGGAAKLIRADAIVYAQTSFSGKASIRLDADTFVFS